jgi:hypothetical protein
VRTWRARGAKRVSRTSRRRRGGDRGLLQGRDQLAQD